MAHGVPTPPPDAALCGLRVLLCTSAAASAGAEVSPPLPAAHFAFCAAGESAQSAVAFVRRQMFHMGTS